MKARRLSYQFPLIRKHTFFSVDRDPTELPVVIWEDIVPSQAARNRPGCNVQHRIGRDERGNIASSFNVNERPQWRSLGERDGSLSEGVIIRIRMYSFGSGRECSYQSRYFHLVNVIPLYTTDRSTRITIIIPNLFLSKYPRVGKYAA